MTDHLHEARERLTRGEYRSAHTNALIALAEEFRRFNDRAEPGENAPAPLQVETLSHPACRSSQWIDMNGDRWYYRGGWHCDSFSPEPATEAQIRRYGPFLQAQS